MYGWTGRIVKVDLTRGDSWSEQIPSELLHSYLGGRGLGVRLMRDHFRLDPFDPQLPLIFVVGPLCGTVAPASSILSIVSRSPLTGTISSSSSGSSFAAGLKNAGYDVLFITGESERPVIITITPDGVAIVAAETLWGRTAGETLSALAGSGNVAAIGPAGENRVLFAGITSGRGINAGRGGLGAVMGGKRLKAVVAKGGIKTAVADEKRLLQAGENGMRLFRASPFLFGEMGVNEYGTPALVDLMELRRVTPTENFRKSSFPCSRNYSGPAIRRAYKAIKSDCCDCPIKCGKISDNGLLLPEYDAVSHFGALIGNGNLESIVKANALCSELGMDAVSTAATLSAWGEWRGSFPSAGELPRLILDLAMRRGEGDLLAEGSRRAMAVLGRPELSMSVKSLELPACDPRGSYGTALAYCTSNRGGCYLGAYPVSHEILRKPVPTDRFSFSGKARIIAIAEDTYAAGDSIGVCRLALLGASLEEYGEMLAAVIGIEQTAGELQQAGARIHLTERFYNAANGFEVKDDSLPERFYRESGSGGEGVEIPPIDRRRFDEELQKYYRIRGLTPGGTFEDIAFLDEQP